MKQINSSERRLWIAKIVSPLVAALFAFSVFAFFSVEAGIKYVFSGKYLFGMLFAIVFGWATSNEARRHGRNLLVGYYVGFIGSFIGMFIYSAIMSVKKSKK